MATNIYLSKNCNKNTKFAQIWAKWYNGLRRYSYPNGNGGVDDGYHRDIRTIKAHDPKGRIVTTFVNGNPHCTSYSCVNPNAFSYRQKRLFQQAVAKGECPLKAITDDLRKNKAVFL